MDKTDKTDSHSVLDKSKALHYIQLHQIKKFFNNFFTIIFVCFLISGVVGGIIYNLILASKQAKKEMINRSTSANVSLENKNTKEPNPKIEVLTTFPPIDPNIIYNIILYPQDNTYVYSINKNRYTASSSATVVVNGKLHKTYKEIDNLIVSSDGKRVAYKVIENDKEFVVVDGKEGKRYDYIKNLKFSHDSKRFAYGAGEGKYFQANSFISGLDVTENMFIVIDEVEGNKYEGTYIGTNVKDSYNPVFSKDGEKVAYVAYKNNNRIIVLGNEEISQYSFPYSPHFINNSSNLAYIVIENKKHFLIESGKKKEVHDHIELIENPNFFEQHYQPIYNIRDGKTEFISTNGSSYEVNSSMGLFDVTLSNSGSHLAYYTGTRKKQSLFVDGKYYGDVVYSLDQYVAPPVFSPDNKLLIYSFLENKMHRSEINIINVNPLQKIATIPIPDLEGIGQIKFSDDSKKIFFKAYKNRSLVLVTVNIASFN